MYQRGDIISVPFPFTNLEKNKLRSALVISNAELMTGTGDVIIVMITSKTHVDGLNIEIEKEDFDFALPKTSYVRCHRIVTIDNSVILGKIGEASQLFLNKVKNNIVKIISENSPEEQLLQAIFKD